jgi:hypothetical protein
MGADHQLFFGGFGGFDNANNGDECHYSQDDKPFDFLFLHIAIRL